MAIGLKTSANMFTKLSRISSPPSASRNPRQAPDSSVYSGNKPNRWLSRQQHRRMAPGAGLKLSFVYKYKLDRALFNPVCSTLFLASILLFAAANTQTVQSVTEAKVTEPEVDKIWLLGSAKPEPPPNYVYEFNETSANSYQLHRSPLLQPTTESSWTAITGNGSTTSTDDQLVDLTGIASILKPSYRSSQTAPPKSRSTTESPAQKANRKSIEAALDVQSQSDSNRALINQKKNNNNKLVYLKRQSKKLSLTSLLPKSKRQDSSSGSQSSPTGDVRKAAAKSLHSRSFEGFLPGGISSQPMMPYGANQLLFMPPAAHQLPMAPFSDRSFFSFPPPPDIGHNQLMTLNHAQSMQNNQFNPISAAQILNQFNQQQHQQQQQVQQQQHQQQQQQLRLNKQNEPTVFYHNNNQNQIRHDDSRERIKLKVVQDNKVGESITHNQASSGPASTVAMLGERAKNFISQISLGGPSSDKGHQDLSQHNVVSNGMMKSATNNVGLASMIKNAADAWAVNNVGTDSTPTIIVEHDGPTITSVDFGNNAIVPRQRRPLVEADDSNNEAPPEDEEVTSFYSTEEEESGSHNSKRLRKPDQPHPFGQSVGSQAIQTQTSFADEFFNTQPDSHEQDYTKKSKSNDPDIIDDVLQEYVRYTKLNDRGSNFPDSIKAIKEQNHGSRVSDLSESIGSKLDSSNNDQIEQLIKELQDLKRMKKKNYADDDSKRVDDYEEASSGGSDEEEDDRTRLLRKKILARLRGKSARSRKKSSEVDYSGDPAIKIPLHALLIAALDRRMSSSEQSQQTATPDNEDRGEVSGSLGSLINANNLFESLIKARGSASNSSSSSPASEPSKEHENVPAMFILNHFGQPEQVNLRSDQSTGAEADASENSGPANSTGAEEPQVNNSPEQEEQVTAETTRAPTVAPRRLSGRETLRDNRMRSSQAPDRQSDASEESPRDQDDFDVDKRVEEFARDKDDPPIRTQWSGRGSGRAKDKGKGRRLQHSSVEFDDDDFDDHSKSSSRKKVLKRRRLPPKLDENAYRRSEENFLKNIQRDTNDVEKNPTGIDDPIEASNEVNSGEKRSRITAIPNRYDDEDGPPSGGDEDKGDGEEENQRSQRSPDDNEARAGQTNGHGAQALEGSTWKPQMIDDEVRKLERVAETKRRQRRLESNEDSGYSNDYEPGKSTNEDNQKYEDTSESRTHGTTVPPEGKVKATDESNGSGSAMTLVDRTSNGSARR